MRSRLAALATCASAGAVATLLASACSSSPAANGAAGKDGADANAGSSSGDDDGGGATHGSGDSGATTITTGPPLDSGLGAPSLDGGEDPASHGGTLTFEQIGAPGWFPSRRDPAGRPPATRYSFVELLPRHRHHHLRRAHALGRGSHPHLARADERGADGGVPARCCEQRRLGARLLVGSRDRRRATDVGGHRLRRQRHRERRLPRQRRHRVPGERVDPPGLPLRRGELAVLPAAVRRAQGLRRLVRLEAVRHPRVDAARDRRAPTLAPRRTPATGTTHRGSVSASASWCAPARTSAASATPRTRRRGYLADGCGQFNVFEVVNDNDSSKNLDVFSTDMIDYAGYVGQGPCGSAWRRRSVGGRPSTSSTRRTTPRRRAASWPHRPRAPASPSAGPESGYRYFLVLLDVASRTVQLGMVHPRAVPSSIAPLLPSLPAAVPQSAIDAVRALRLPAP